MPSQYEKVLLENGATLVLEKNDHMRSVSMGVWVKIGSGSEPKNLNGVSHFLEHMVFKGTSKRTGLEIATVLECLGGELNAFTDREVTCYHATVLSEHAPIAIEVLSDLTLSPQFPKNEIDLEKKVLLQELSMIEESPDDKIYDLFFRSVWKDQPLGQPVIGSKATIDSFNRSTALKFFDQYYHPKNMVISVAGNINIPEMIEQCETLFRASDRAFHKKELKRSVTYHGVHKKAVVPTDQLHLMVGFDGVTLHDSARFDALVLNFYLGGGMSSRLFQEIREKAGLAYTVECDFIPFSEAGLFSFYLALAPKTLGKCLSILSREVQRVASEPISVSALERIKSQIKGSIILASESVEARQESLGRNEIYFGRHISTEEIVAEIEKVSIDRVQNMAKQFFKEEKESVITLSRVKPKQRKVSLFL